MISLCIFIFPIPCFAVVSLYIGCVRVCVSAHSRPHLVVSRSSIYTYKRVVCVCWFVGLLVCFLSATRHLSTLRRCLRVLREQPSRRGRPRARGGQACTARARAHAHAVQLLNEKIAALMPFKNKSVRARACCRIRTCRDFQKKGKRKPTCHFPSSVYSLPSLGVFTFRIVLNRILHKSSLLAPMESRRTRRPTFTAEERLE